MSKNPQIWASFDGKRIQNGKKKSYWIQTATEEYHDEIVKNMTSGFLVDEPLCRYSNVVECKESLDSIINLFEEMFKKKLVLLCLTKESSEKQSQIAGINVTYASKEKEGPEYEPIGEKWKKIYGIVDYFTQKLDVYQFLHIDTYLSAMGLFVLPEFRGEGIGLEMLKAREPLCRAVGIKASCTVFTSIISQKLAERAGFKDLLSVSYEDLFKERPDLFIPNVQEHSKCCRFMCNQYK